MYRVCFDAMTMRFVHSDKRVHVVHSIPRPGNWGMTACGALYDWEPRQGGRWVSRLAVKTDEVPTCLECVTCAP